MGIRVRAGRGIFLVDSFCLGCQVHRTYRRLHPTALSQHLGICQFPPLQTARTRDSLRTNPAFESTL